MKIRNVVHKRLRRFIEDGDASGLNPRALDRIENILSFLSRMRAPEEMRQVPSWRAHRLTGRADGMWSLRVTRNWRLTFGIDEERGEIFDLDYEDYH